LAAALKKNPDLDVNVIDGANGELTVLIEDHELISKGTELPSVEEVVAAVENASVAKQTA
jgi:hypothetical protein